MPPESNEMPCVMIFGNGLIGASICAALTKTFSYDKSYFHFPWNDAPERLECLKRLGAYIDDRNATSVQERIVVIWCAGKAGFGATEDEVLNELDSFGGILDWVSELQRNYTDNPVSFFLISSAGGLFEGQKYVTRDSPISALRPYGILKFEQEQLLAANSVITEKKIFRLTSVYGYYSTTQRIGLIPTLVSNCINNRVTKIVGRPDTLRDFVWVEDVARYIANRTLNKSTPESSSSVELLASGKPTSIFEIQKIIERLAGRKLFVSFHDLSNARDITFSPKMLPENNWQSEPLDLCIRKVFNRCILGGGGGR